MRLGFYTHPVSVSALFVADFALSSLWIFLPQGGGPQGVMRLGFIHILIAFPPYLSLILF